jgi:hypothetical protein
MNILFPLTLNGLLQTSTMCSPFRSALRGVGEKNKLQVASQWLQLYCGGRLRDAL